MDGFWVQNFFPHFWPELRCCLTTHSLKKLQNYYFLFWRQSYKRNFVSQNTKLVLNSLTAHYCITMIYFRSYCAYNFKTNLFFFIDKKIFHRIDSRIAFFYDSTKKHDVFTKVLYLITFNWTYEHQKDILKSCWDYNYTYKLICTLVKLV
jgi:hypothetical protein